MAVVILNRSIRRRAPALLWLALATACGALCAGVSNAAIMQITIDQYVLSIENPRANYFHGALLTANDLSQEQSYHGSGMRYLPPTDVPFEELLQSAGFADVVLSLDEEKVLPGERSHVNPDDRYGDDFIVLDLQHGTWRGRLFVEEIGDIQQGVYDELSGTYRDFTGVPEPGSLLLMMFGMGSIGGMAGLRRILRARRTI